MALNLTPDVRQFLDEDTDSSLFNTGIVSKAVKISSLSLVMLVSVVGNILVIHAICSDRRRHTVTNIFIISQSAADIGTSLLVLPFALVSVGHDGWIFGRTLCIVNGFFNLFFTQITVLQLTVLSFDRYLVISKNTDHSFKLGKAIKIIAWAWCLSFLGSFPWLPLFSKRVHMTYLPGFYVCGQRFMHPVGGFEIFMLAASVVSFAILPLIVIFYCFWKIQGVIHQNQHRIGPLSPSNAQKLAAIVHASSAAVSRRVVATTLVQVFPACFTLVLDGLQLFDISYSFETTVKWIMWSHCMVKPLIYATKNSTLTNSVWKYLRARTRKIFVLLMPKCNHKTPICRELPAVKVQQNRLQAWTAKDQTENFYQI